jgi:hypothetical protein
LPLIYISALDDLIMYKYYFENYFQTAWIYKFWKLLEYNKVHFTGPLNPESCFFVSF